MRGEDRDMATIDEAATLLDQFISRDTPPPMIFRFFDILRRQKTAPKVK